MSLPRLPLRYSLPAVLLLGAVLIGVVSYVYNANLVEQEVIHEGKREVMALHLMRNDLEYALQRQDMAHVAHVVAELGSRADMVGSYFVDDRGVVLAATDQAAIGEQYEPAAVLAKVASTIKPVIEIDNDSIYIRYPVMLAPAADELRSTRMGYLYAQTDLTRRLYEARQHIILQALSFSGFLVIIALALWLYIYRVIGRRIEQLQSAVQAVGAGDLRVRADLEQGDEFGALAQSFNHMGEQLEQQQGHLHALQQALDEHAIVSITDVAGRITFVNDRFCDVSRYSRDELLGQNHRLLKSAAHSDEFYQQLWRTISSGQIWQGVIQNLRKDGKPYWVQSTIVPILDDEGHPGKYISVRTDVTQRERLRRAMEQLATATPGEQSFDVIASAVCTGLQCRWAGFGRLINDGKEVEMQGFCNDGVVGENFNYMMAGTPCEEVCTRERPLVITENVIARYPNDPILVEMGAVSYRGEPLLREDGSVFGVFFAIDDQPCIDDEAERALLRLAAKRAAMEFRRVESEQALRDNQLQLAQAQHMAQLGSWTLDYVTNELVWSDEVYRIFEIDKAKFNYPYDAFLAAIHPADRELVSKAYQVSVDNRTPYSIVHRLLMKDGRVKWVHERGETYYDEDGKPQRSIGFVHDITDQAQMEREKELLSQSAIIAAETDSFHEALQRNLELVCDYAGWPVGHAYLVDSEQQQMVSLGIWHFDDEQKHLNFREVTEQFNFVKGYGLPGRIWKSERPEWISNIQTDSNFPRAKACHELKLKGGFGFPVVIDGHVEAVMEFFDYDSFVEDPALVTSLMLYAEQLGRIFERHNRDRQLYESEQRFEVSQAYSNVATFEWNIQSNKTYWSTQFWRMLGLQPDSVEPSFDEYMNRVHPDDRQRLQDEMTVGIQNGEDVDVEYRLVWPDDSRHWVRVRAGIERDKDNQPLRMLGVIMDIDSQKLAEQEQNSLMLQLQQAQKMESIGQLTGGIAHDFNNMLSAIIGFTSLSIERFAQDDPHGKLNQYLSQVLQAGERGRDLVAQMLAFGRSQPGEQKLVDAALLIQEVVNLLGSTLPSSISMDVSLADDVPAVMVDPVQLHQVLTNLAINARDAVGEHGHIEIELSGLRHHDGLCSSCYQLFSGQFIEISVCDDGHGISAEQHGRVFEPFFSTKEVGKGTGMGLSMVHGILHQCNGHILLDSDSDMGTCFRLLLPPAPAEKLVEQDEQIISPAETAAGKCIMVVDDEVSLSEFFSELLSGCGYQVCAFNNPLEALKYFENDPDGIDLVITDQTMPQLTGVELSKKMLARRSNLPIVLCTGYSETIDEKGASRLGIAEFLQKPVATDRLLHSIVTLLNGDK